jgi:serine/threonine protein kinase
MAALVELPCLNAQRMKSSDAVESSDSLPTRVTPPRCPDSLSANTPDGYVIKADRLLGEGSYSSVYEAFDINSGKVVVAKLTDLSMKLRARCHRNEVGSFKYLGIGHPNLVKYYSDFTDNEIGFIILEKLSSISLEDYIANYGRLGLQEALEIFGQIVSVVVHMHERHLSPRDLKPENIAYDPEKNEVKLFDLGLAMLILPNAKGEIPFVNVTTGSPLFMAPEVIACKPHSSFAHDIWCLGQILYVLLTGQSAFNWCSSLAELRDELLVFKKIKYPPWLDFRTTQFLQGMLEFDPKLRLDVRGVMDGVKKLQDNQLKVQLKKGGNDA